METITWISSDGFQNQTEYNETDLALPELPIDMKFNDGHRLAIVMYLSLFITSTIGNLYAFYSIISLRRNGKIRRINLLLLNLTVADLFVTFLMMPLEIVWSSTVSWLAGDFVCRVLSFFRVFGLYLSGFIIICISLDRYWADAKPLAAVKAKKRGRKLLAVAWIGSMLCSLPQPFIFHVERHPDFPWYEQCVTFNAFPSPEYELFYNLFGFCFMYAIPMITIVYCYSAILSKIHEISNQRKLMCENQLRRSNGMVIERAKAKTLAMTMTLVILFTIFWTPYNFISLWYWFDKPSAQMLDQRVQKVLFAFACSNSCINPIIYGCFHAHGTKTTAARDEMVLRRLSGRQNESVKQQSSFKKCRVSSSTRTMKQHTELRITDNPCCTE